MQAVDYALDQDGITTFVRSETSVTLSQLLGLACGQCGRDEGPDLARGLALVDTSAGRCEADGLKVESATFGADQVRIVWRDLPGVLRIESLWTFNPQTGIWSRKDSLQNTGVQPLALYRYFARFVFSPCHYEVYSQYSAWCHENQGLWRGLHHGSLVLGCEGGRTTQGGTPFMALRECDGRAGVAFHVLPRGNWTIRARTQMGGGDSLPFVVIELGLADEALRLVLPAQSRLDLPEILLHSLPQGEVHLAAPRLHRYAVSRLETRAQRETPVVYNTWFDAFDDLDVPRLRRQLAAARAIGCEVFTVDAGWYGQASGMWHLQTGDWREKRDAAFHGHMAEFAKEVRAAGLGFGLWVEPERIGQLAPILSIHPEWFLPGTNACHYPNLDDSHAYAYVLGELVRLVEQYSLAWMKVDFNFSLGMDPSGAEFSAYYAAWYRLLDELRSRFPETFFEGCASGGMRSDLSTLSHFDGHFLSDTVDPIDALRLYEGALLRLPPGRLGKWVVLRSIGQAVPQYGLPLAQSPSSVVAPMGATWERAATVGVDFYARVGLAGQLGFSGDMASLPESALERLRFHIAFFKEWRAFIAGSVAHLLTPPRLKQDRRGWAALQLQQPGGGKSLLFAYRLDDASDRRRYYPRDLLAEQHYVVRDVDRPAESVVRTGNDLMRVGIEVNLPARHSAALICLSEP